MSKIIRVQSSKGTIYIKGEMLKMKEDRIVKTYYSILFLIALITIPILMFIGFGNIYTSLLNQSKSDIFILITLPLIAGSILDKEYRAAKTFFLLSSLIMIISFLAFYSSGISWLNNPGLGLMGIGALIFSVGVVFLTKQIIWDIRKEVRRKRKSS